jgi:hypothetical protein
VIPIATGFLLRKEERGERKEERGKRKDESAESISSLLSKLLLILTIFLVLWNTSLYVQYLLF